jgi:tetratricopeptide (TPR) repeat protein
MQEQSKSASERQAEVLEWMGTAYGRRRIANSDAQSNEVALPAISHANSSTASRSDRLAGYLAAIGGYKRGVTAGLAGFLAVVIAVALIQVRASDSLPDVTQTATSARAEPQQTGTQEPASAQLPQDAVPRVEFERAAREAEMQLASEHEARIALEGQVGQLTSELAAQKLASENAEQANAATSAALAAERKARTEAEDAAKSSKEALARMASSAAAAPVAAAAAPPQPTQAEPKPVETHSPPWEANVRVVNASIDVGVNSDAATSALLEGEKLFAKGDIEEARQRFEQAAKMGMPEAALALGNTYDRVSLAKAGLNLTGDPTRARQWYRRALELAQVHPEPRQ